MKSHEKILNFFLQEVDIIIFQMISHPSLFNISKYEKRDTEKRVSEMCNCPL